jgi:hypothetical protein
VCSNLVCSGSPKCTAGPCEIAFCNVTGQCYTQPIDNCTSVTSSNSASTSTGSGPGSSSTSSGSTTTGAPEGGSAVTSSSNGGKTNVGAIVAGVVVGVAVLIAGIVGAVFYMKRRAKKMYKNGEELELQGPEH